MELVTTVLCTLLSILAMFAITRIIGYRQMSEMTLFDYVNGITVGSIGAELATAKADEFLAPLCAAAIYGAVTVLLAVITSKSRKARGYINGTPLILFKSGKIYRKNFKKAHIDLDEFFMQCRNQGYFDLSEAECIILETNGSMSILPKAACRPAAPKDFNIAVPAAAVPEPVILDGITDTVSLSRQGLSEQWLKKNLDTLGFSSPSQVFFAYVSDGTLYAFPDVKN